ncbi:DsrE family protein [Thiomicrorhabdus sp. Milos-T2]|uniref:DsrE family protein n=1 Tax=Thiomicrorhabdus sp. Milos-T2 TaxID=90814 RepID=UPI000494D5A4|nr:DsrE family protein [Thiomicrorhabdus sp. Milos-T2]
MKQVNWIIATFALALMVVSVNCKAEQTDKSLPKMAPEVQQILALNEEPDGIVFDIETLDVNALPEYAPFVRDQIMLIRQKFPNVDIAVVTHGAEEFALQKQAKGQQKLHNLFNQLVQEEEVSIHVCGAVAGLKKLSQEDFPDFVSFSASGMAQLNDYIAIGYTVVPIRQLNKQERKDLFEQPKDYLR